MKGGFSARPSALHAHAGRLGDRADQVGHAGSGASGAGLHGNALGEIGSGSAANSQSFASNAGGLLGQVSTKLHSQASLLSSTGHSISNVDSEHADALSKIHSHSEVMRVGDQSGIEIAKAGSKRPADGPPPGPGLAAKIQRINTRPEENTDWPSAPPQKPFGPGHVPDTANQHVTHGDYKPPYKPKKGKAKPAAATGGHVIKPDVHEPPKVNAHGNAYGQGVVPGSGTGTTGPKPNGVYEVTKPNVDFGPGGNVPKNGMSSMFPTGLPDTAVHGMGKSAFNGGAPYTTEPTAATKNWSGSAQIPFTPKWNPGYSDHGSGSTNHPNAGHVVNMDGYAHQEPIDPANPGAGTKYVAETYYPNANQPPSPPPQDFLDP